MKFTFIFILFSTLAFSQQKIPNLTSITLHKIYEIGNDGPCNSFKYPQDGWSIATTKVSDCDSLVLRLINYKADLKNKKSQTTCCSRGSIGCYDIENMLTYQYNKLVDTLYFNNYDNEILTIDYNNGREYFDDKMELLKIINREKKLKDFFEAPIDKLFREIYQPENCDSIGVAALTIKEKSIYGLNKKEIELLIDGFDPNSDIEIERNPTTGMESFKCYASNYDSYNQYYFVNDLPIYKMIVKQIEEEDNFFTSEKPFYICGIKTSDNEIKLIEKFPNSTKYLENQKKYFKDKNGDYTISIKIKEDKGYVSFVLNNAKVKQIEIDFRYPRN